MVSSARLLGLVLAGGRGSRLGRDKGSLVYHGVPQARWAAGRLTAHCAAVFVSIRAEQVALPSLAGMALIPDAPGFEGPAAGLIAALRHDAGSAWLLLAADMPFIDARTLNGLVAGRDSAMLATAYRRPDGTIEPLCSIWEPTVLPLLETLGPRLSMRQVLETAPVRLLVPADSDRLDSVNTPEQDRRARARFSARDGA